jgi:hypothetical protein
MRAMGDPVTTGAAPAPRTAMTGPRRTGISRQTARAFLEAPAAWPVGGVRRSHSEATSTQSSARARPSIVQREAIQRRSLALADMVSAGLALLVSVTVVGMDQLTPLSLIGLPLVVLASKLIGLYDHDELVLRKSTLEDAPKLFQLATLYALASSGCWRTCWSSGAWGTDRSSDCGPCSSCRAWSRAHVRGLCAERSDPRSAAL